MGRTRERFQVPVLYDSMRGQAVFPRISCEECPPLREDSRNGKHRRERQLDRVVRQTCMDGVEENRGPTGREAERMNPKKAHLAAGPLCLELLLQPSQLRGD